MHASKLAGDSHRAHVQSLAPKDWVWVAIKGLNDQQTIAACRAALAGTRGAAGVPGPRLRDEGPLESSCRPLALP